MIIRKRYLSGSVLLLCMLSVYLFSDSVVDTSSAAQDAPLSITRKLPPLLENQEMRIVEVTLSPGEASPPHRHNAFVYVYVLEGEVEMQVRGGELKRLQPGDTFFELPDDVHQVGRNLSASEPARFLVHMLKSVGASAYTEI
ncbi:MAG: cupin domain-containing protein [Pseudomonadales bacterium]|nr:cupin domain-containing protein [Pseudomonadales bacterium]